MPSQRMQLKHVLIVDDEPKLVKMLAVGLEKVGKNCVIETALSGQEALAKLQQTHYTLLITDYAMQDMNGLDLAEAVRRLSPETQIVLMTAYGTERLRNLAGHMHLDGYIDKPFSMSQIREIVARAVGQTEKAQPSASDDPYRTGERAADEAVSNHLQALRTDTGARCVLLLSSGGYSVQMAGATHNLDLSSIGALVAANFLAAAELAKLLGTGSVFTSSYHEGNDYNIYAYKINDDLLLAVIFGSESKPGVVWFYTKQTAAILLPLVPATPSKVNFAADISAALNVELDMLLGDNDHSQPTPANNGPALDHRDSRLQQQGGSNNSKIMSFEEAVTAGLVPPNILNRERKR